MLVFFRNIQGVDTVYLLENSGTGKQSSRGPFSSPEMTLVRRHSTRLGKRHGPLREDIGNCCAIVPKSFGLRAQRDESSGSDDPRPVARFHYRARASITA